jgi:hypothetical protein
VKSSHIWLIIVGVFAAAILIGYLNHGFRGSDAPSQPDPCTNGQAWNC